MDFSYAAALTISTGRLMCEMDELYRIASHLEGRSIHTIDMAVSESWAKWRSVLDAKCGDKFRARSKAVTELYESAGAMSHGCVASSVASLTSGMFLEL